MYDRPWEEEWFRCVFGKGNSVKWTEHGVSLVMCQQRGSFWVRLMFKSLKSLKFKQIYCLPLLCMGLIQSIRDPNKANGLSYLNKMQFSSEVPGTTPQVLLDTRLLVDTADVGFTSLCNHLSQFLIINLFLFLKVHQTEHSNMEWKANAHFPMNVWCLLFTCVLVVFFVELWLIQWPKESWYLKLTGTVRESEEQDCVQRLWPLVGGISETGDIYKSW